MSLLRRIFSPRSAEETRGEGSDNNDSVGLPSPPVPQVRRERARLQRRSGATAPTTSTKETTPRGTRSLERIRNLKGHATRALRIASSSVRGSSPESTERLSTPPVNSAQLKREQVIESFEVIAPHAKALGSIPATVCSSSAIEATNTPLQLTATDKSPELSAPSPTVPESSSSLSPPSTIVQFKAENTPNHTNPLCFTAQYHSSPIEPSTLAVESFSSSPPNPPSITPQLKGESPSAATTAAVLQLASSPFSSSPIGTPTASAAKKYLYSIPQYHSPPVETTTSAVSQSTSSPLSSPISIAQSQGVEASAATTTPTVPQFKSSSLSPPSSIAQFQGGKKSVLPNPHHHLFLVGVPTAADMPKSRKRKSPSIDLEPPRTPKRRSPGIRKHDLNILKGSALPTYHSEPHTKRKRDEKDEGLVCSYVAQSPNEDSTSSQSSHSLYSDHSIDQDSEPDSSHNRRRSGSPSSSPSPSKRAKMNQKQRVNGKKHEENPRSVKIRIKASVGKKRPNTKGKEKSHDNDEIYVDIGQSEESDYHITSAERNDLLYELTRERASRMAEAVKIPPDSGLGSVQVKLVRKLATRGCKPVMSRFWASDFTTWPESLFTSISDGESDSADRDGENLMFKSQNMSDNYAIKALQELFAVSGRVRDCSLLSVEPQFVVGKAIRQYLHWAIDDAGLKTTGQTIPVHCICPRIPGEEIFATIMRCSRKLERLGKRHQMAHRDRETFWPTMIGFVIAGPIVCLLSLDTDPSSEVWSTDDSSDEESPAKFLTQFDLSEREQDVWNSLAVAICVIHLRDTLIELAKSYPASRAVPIIRGLGDETDDEDI
ncbi:uncharacterized protein N7503_005402 [Penicillium pulvis]|uniref:uncharacterized protein n=1 Tax=Penicillium pulvis TaxID=1562058 RepID=UPI00254903CD|nr:uncharacterized protein N7503_005402 [Penicillium pulvis]KAJ5802952.1 hypothetical protein N7503_005402 [Penicillium pulvis]